MPGADLAKDDLEAYRDVGVDQIVALGVAPSAEAVRSVFEPIAEALVGPASLATKAGDRRRDHL